MGIQNDIKPLLLVFPLDQSAHYLRCLTLAKQLHPYFKILFAHSATYSAFVQREGFETFSCLTIDTQKVLQCVRKFDFSWISEENLEPVYKDQVRVLKELKPAAVLGDAFPSLKMAAEKTGIPYIALMNGYMSKYYAYVRKMSRTYPLFTYLNVLPEKVFDFLTQKGESVAFHQVHQPFKNLRRKYGLSRKSYYLDELEGDLNLVCDLPQIFPLKNAPDHYKIIPPLFYDAEAPFTGIAEKLDRKKKTIFVSMGSTGDWEKVCFLNHPHFQQYNIVTAGDREGKINMPSVIKTDFVNIRELFPFTDLVICHGGNGTVYQALLYGIPLLCKTAHFEQEWNVHQLEKLRLAKSLDEVSRIKDYGHYVEQWIERKGKPPYTIYESIMKDVKQTFEETAREIATEILD